MRYVFGFVGALALGLALMAGCGNNENGQGGSGGTAGSGGSAGIGGTGGTGGNGVACQDNVCPCTEAGIRAAVAEGGGPFTFDCDGPTTVVTGAEIVIDNEVILDGGGNLTVDGNDDHTVFVVDNATVELRGFIVTNGNGGHRVDAGGGIRNLGTLTLTHSTVSGNTAAEGGGILNAGELTMTNSTVSGNTATAGGGVANSEEGRATLTSSTVSGNTALAGGGIVNLGALTLINSTVSANEGSGIYNGQGGTSTLINSTVSGNAADDGSGIFNNAGTLTVINSTVSGNTPSHSGILTGAHSISTLTNTVVANRCEGHPIASNGHNIESPGNTCGFDQLSDQPDVTAEELNLGPLQDNGGPTMTHALLPGSVAIDKIPEAECVDADGAPLTTDQRGVARPQGDSCDVGAFELEVAP